MQMVQYECPKHRKPTVSFSFEVVKIPFSHYWPFGVIRMVSQYESENGARTRAQEELNGLHLVQFECAITGRALSHPILKLEDFPFLIIGPVG